LRNRQRELHAERDAQRSDRDQRGEEGREEETLAQRQVEKG
jgi:hypothetical protein